METLKPGDKVLVKRQNADGLGTVGTVVDVLVVLSQQVVSIEFDISKLSKKTTQGIYIIKAWFHISVDKSRYESGPSYIHGPDGMDTYITMPVGIKDDLDSLIIILEGLKDEL